MSGDEIADLLQQAVDIITHFAGDFLAFLIVGGIIAAFAFYFGRNRIVPLVASLYAAIPIYTVFPYTEYITTPLVSIVLYFVIAFLAYIAFSGLASFVATGSIGFINLLILSATVAGMLIAVSIHILPVEQLYTFSAPTRALFASTEAFFFWLVAPLVAVFVFGRG